MKAFLFVDWYKTLSFGHMWHKVESPLKESVQALVFGDDLTSGLGDNWMRGKATSEEINNFVARELGIAYKELWGLFVESSQTIGVDQEALELLEKLQETYTTVLITDNMDSLTRFTAPAYKLEKVFTKIVNSYDVGVRKCDLDGAIFKLVTTDFKKSILLDDREDNCVLFEKLGGKSFQVTKEYTLVSHLTSLLYK